MKLSQMFLIIAFGALYSSVNMANCLTDYGPGYGTLMARCTAVVSGGSAVDAVDICIQHRIVSSSDGPLDTYVVAGSFGTADGVERIFASGSHQSFLSKMNTPWSDLNDGILTVHDTTGLVSSGKSIFIYNTNSGSLNVNHHTSNGDQYSFQANCQRP
jgi:hypothetical protein